MKAYARRRLLASAKLGLVAVPFSVALRLGHGYGLTPGSFALGFGLGFAVGLAEFFLLGNWLKDRPFSVHLAGKSLALVGVLYLTGAALNLLDVVVEGVSWQAYFRFVLRADTLVGMTEALVVVAVLLFFVHLDRLLGPGVLLGLVSGRYHRPRREARIFMFLDLKGSTRLADAMDAERYFSFLHRCFCAMSEAILETGAEIYQYVGDEVVLTWTMRSGTEESNCIRVFFLVEDRLRAEREQFVRDYGVAPEFKAGVHAGEVVTAQIGELKSEIVHSGAVLNTCARIQSVCNQFGEKLLVSADLVRRLELGPQYAVVALGPVPLRGKSESVEICALRRAGP